MGAYAFADQYQQAPAPLGGGLVKPEWFKRYTPRDKPEGFDRVVQSWDTANKATELSVARAAANLWGERRADRGQRLGHAADPGAEP
jgi:phage terminase large subunit-like protein